MRKAFAPLVESWLRRGFGVRIRDMDEVEAALRTAETISATHDDVATGAGQTRESALFVSI